MRTGELANSPLGFSWRSGMPYREFGSHNQAALTCSRATASRVQDGRQWALRLAGMGKVHLLAGPSQALSLLGRATGKGRPAATVSRYLGTSKFRLSLA